MKTKLFLLALFISTWVIAQVSTVYTGLNTPTGLASYGNNLYLAETQSSRIVKFDISNNSPSLQIVSITSGSEGLAIQSNNLRITNLTGVVKTLNVLAPIPTTTSTYHGTLGGVGARAITYDSTHGLYIGTAYQGNSTRIYKVNGINSSTLIATIPGTDVRGMQVIGNILYAAQRALGRIYSMDLTQANPSPVIFKSGIYLAYDLAAVGNSLYITTEAGRLYKISDVTVNNPPLTTLISGGYGAFSGIEIIGQDIYMSGWANGGRILKYTDASIPHCHIPTNVQASVITETSTNISWTGTAATNTSYDLVYVESGQPIANGTTISNITATSQVLTGLTPGQTYDVYIKGNCSGAVSTSAYTSAITFLSATKLYVDIDATGANNGSTWTDAFTSLTDALQNVPNDIDIWMAEGTYTPHVSDRNSSFVIQTNNLKLYGGFNGTETLLSERDFKANETIFSGDLLSDDNANVSFNNATRDDNSLRVVQVNGNNVKIDGVTIANGYADAAAGEGRFGAGLSINAAVGQLTIKNSIIKQNVAMWAAGLNLSSNASGSSINIDACTFENNLASISSVSFYAIPSANATMDISITNSLFKNNTTEDNGGVKANGASAGWIRAHYTGSTINATVVNNTFVNNVNKGTGGGDYPTLGISQTSGSFGALNIANNIFWGNTQNGGATALSIGKVVATAVPSTMQIHTSIDGDSFSIIPNVNLINTSNSNPMFTNYAGGDYTLQSGSPAKDSGDNSKIPVGITGDLLGNARIFNTTVDMGVYEYVAPLGLSENNTLKSFTVFPNPTKGNLHISSNEPIEKVEVYNYIGQQVLKSTEAIVNTANLSNGIYLLKVYVNSGKVGVKRFVKE